MISKYYNKNCCNCRYWEVAKKHFVKGKRAYESPCQLTGEVMCEDDTCDHWVEWKK